jgi:hypothetical protein
MLLRTDNNAAANSTAINKDRIYPVPARLLNNTRCDRHGVDTA